MSELKSWADYSPAELLEALERTEPRYPGDLYVWMGGVHRAAQQRHELVCSAELLRVLVESIRLWQRTACDSLNALEEIKADYDWDDNTVGWPKSIQCAEEVLERYKHLQTEEANNAP